MLRVHLPRGPLAFHKYSSTAGRRSSLSHEAPVCAREDSNSEISRARLILGMLARPPSPTEIGCYFRQGRFADDAGIR